MPPLTPPTASSNVPMQSTSSLADTLTRTLLGTPRMFADPFVQFNPVTNPEVPQDLVLPNLSTMSTLRPLSMTPNDPQAQYPSPIQVASNRLLSSTTLESSLNLNPGLDTLVSLNVGSRPGSRQQSRPQSRASTRSNSPLRTSKSTELASTIKDKVSDLGNKVFSIFRSKNDPEPDVQDPEAEAAGVNKVCLTKQEVKDFGDDAQIMMTPTSSKVGQSPRFKSCTSEVYDWSSDQDNEWDNDPETGSNDTTLTAEQKALKEKDAKKNAEIMARFYADRSGSKYKSFYAWHLEHKRRASLSGSGAHGSRRSMTSNSSPERSRSASMKRTRDQISPDQMDAKKEKTLAKKKCRCDKDIIMNDCPFHRAHYLKENEVFQAPKSSKLKRRKRNTQGKDGQNQGNQKKLEAGKDFEIKTKNRFDVIDNDNSSSSSTAKKKSAGK